jgi:hypothetical protein
MTTQLQPPHGDGLKSLLRHLQCKVDGLVIQGHADNVIIDVIAALLLLQMLHLRWW